MDETSQTILWFPSFGLNILLSYIPSVVSCQTFFQDIRRDFFLFFLIILTKTSRISLVGPSARKDSPAVVLISLGLR